ncbi:unnamed protein product, partial [Musa textilis]
CFRTTRRRGSQGPQTARPRSWTERSRARSWVFLRHRGIERNPSSNRESPGYEYTPLGLF